MAQRARVVSTPIALQRGNTARSPNRYSEYKFPTYGQAYVEAISAKLRESGYVIQTAQDFDSLAVDRKKLRKFELCTIHAGKNSDVNLDSVCMLHQLNKQAEEFLSKLRRYSLFPDNNILLLEVLSRESTSAYRNNETTVVCVLYAYQLPYQIPNPTYVSRNVDHTRENTNTAPTKQRAVSVSTEV